MSKAPAPKQPEVQTGKQKIQKRVTIVWLLPLIALAIGAWMIYSNFIERDITITIHFNSGAGLVAGKTQVKHKGVNIGEVKKLSLDENLKGVAATVSISRSAESALKEGAQFWVVEPRISFLGVSGLDTIVSGSYIEMRPGHGKPMDDYKALSSPPPLPESEPGLHLVLKTGKLGSIHPDSPVLYKKVVVGSVQSYEFNADNTGVDIKIFIESKYENLVTKNSRFWNSSGISLTGDIKGLSLQVESLASIIVGGISFFNPESRSAKNMKQCQNGDTFTLYDDYKSADAGIPVRIGFETANGLVPEKTKVFYKGVEVGLLKKIDIGKTFKGIVGEFVFVPNVEPALNSTTRFWAVKPKLSLTEISGLDTLLSGVYIEMTFNLEGSPKREFTILKEPPLRLDQERGLTVTLKSDDLGSINRGTPVYYRKMKVGSVLSYHMARDKHHFNIDANIDEPYVSLVRSNSKFWNTSGISVKGDINGVDIKTESLETVISGGIAFNTPDDGGKAVKKGHEFVLFDDYDSAKENGLPITIRLNSGYGLKEGAQIRYLDVQVGTIKKIKPDSRLSSVVVNALMNREASELAVEGTQFWVVKPKLGILETSHLETLISGNYLSLVPGKGKPARDFVGVEAPPSDTQKTDGLKLTLAAARLGSIKKGVPIYYKEVPVGQVLGYRLSDSADKVLISISISSSFAPLVHKNTKFWNVSGVDFDYGLFRGASLKMGSIESVIGGGISFATPPPPDMGEPAKENDTFKLNDKADKTWLGWSPVISLNR